jgi:CheY-like chemotaxis protein
MDKVLIVDDDEAFLEELKDSVSRISQFELLCAPDGEKAVEIFSKIPVSVFVTDINAKKIESLELLSLVSINLPGIPCIVMSGYGKPWFYRPLEQNEILYHTEKPVDVPSLLSAILVALSIKDETREKRSISLKSLLPIIELEGKSCRMEVITSGPRKAYLYFDDGALFDAHFKNLKPENVVNEILKWENISFKFSDLPRRRGQKRLNIPIMDLVSATWEKAQVLNGSKTQPPDPESDISIIRKVTEKLLLSQIRKFRTVKGYKGIAILDNDYHLLASDGIDNKTLDLSKFIKEMAVFFTDVSSIIQRHGFTKSKMITYHTSTSVIQILYSFDQPLQPMFLVGITETDGNWYFLKFELENLEKLIMEILRRPINVR